MPKTVKEWLLYLASLRISSIELGLQRVEPLAKREKLHRFSCPVITVAGTNGKGSCVRVLESIYKTAGYQVGAYYSPHLQRFNERICINGREIEDDFLLSGFQHIESIRGQSALSFFEFTTLSALWLFKQSNLDILILEVGMGGRLDAVNLVDSDAALVVSVGLDHLDYLGDNRESIGYEKAGVFRPNKPAICADADPPKSLVKAAVSIGARLFLVNRDFYYHLSLDSWDWSGRYMNCLKLPLPSLKCQSAAAALMAIECLLDRIQVDESYIKQGLAIAQLSGRFQMFSRPVQGVLDVAHNPDSAFYLASQLCTLPILGKKIAIVGMLANKDIANTLKPLLPYIDLWLIARLDTDRTADPAEIAHYLYSSGIKNYYCFKTVELAFQRAVQICSDDKNFLLVFGSFYTVAAVQALLNSVKGRGDGT